MESMIYFSLAVEFLLITVVCSLGKSGQSRVCAKLAWVGEKKIVSFFWFGCGWFVGWQVFF